MGCVGIFQSKCVISVCSGVDYSVLKELKDLKVGVKSIIIGTVFKKLCLRPNILKEFSEKVL